MPRRAPSSVAARPARKKAKSNCDAGHAAHRKIRPVTMSPRGARSRVPRAACDASPRSTRAPAYHWARPLIFGRALRRKKQPNPRHLHGKRTLFLPRQSPQCRTPLIPPRRAARTPSRAARCHASCVTRRLLCASAVGVCNSMCCVSNRTQKLFLLPCRVLLDEWDVMFFRI